MSNLKLNVLDAYALHGLGIAVEMAEITEPVAETLTLINPDGTPGITAIVREVPNEKPKLTREQRFEKLNDDLESAIMRGDYMAAYDIGSDIWVMDVSDLHVKLDHLEVCKERWKAFYESERGESCVLRDRLLVIAKERDALQSTVDTIAHESQGRKEAQARGTRRAWFSFPALVAVIAFCVWMVVRMAR